MWYAIIWLMTSFPFFLNTWEEYYTGELNFPLIHGVSEGTLVACFAMIMTGIFGDHFWHAKIEIFGIVTRFNHLIVFPTFIAGIGFGLNSLINVVRNYKDKEDIIQNLFIFIYLVVSLILVVLLSDSKIVKYYPKILIVLYGFAFAKLVGHLQLAHLSDAKFMQYRKSLLLTFFVLALQSIAQYFFNVRVVDTDYLIIGFLVLHIVVWIHFAYYLTEELSEILGIYRFTVERRVKNTKTG
jgi:ethanolaminephosphotransferase